MAETRDYLWKGFLIRHAMRRRRLYRKQAVLQVQVVVKEKLRHRLSLCQQPRQASGLQHHRINNPPSPRLT